MRSSDEKYKYSYYYNVIPMRCKDDLPKIENISFTSLYCFESSLKKINVGLKHYLRRMIRMTWVKENTFIKFNLRRNKKWAKI